MEQVSNTQEFAAVVRKKGPHAKLDMKSRTFFQHQLNKFRDGEEVTVRVSTKKPQRTLAQNSYWWVYMTLIAEETGHTPEEIHEYAKGKFLTEKIVTVFGHQVRMRGSTTGLSKAGFSELIDRVSAETGIQPPPTENYNL